MNTFLDSNSAVNRLNYWGMIALGCLDSLVTLPLVSMGLMIDIRENPFEFYQGWTFLHKDWKPLLIPKSVWVSSGFWGIFNVKWGECINPLFALIFFLLFGTTPQARARYSHVLWFIAKAFWYNSPVKPETSDVVFVSVAFPDSRDTQSS